MLPGILLCWLTQLWGNLYQHVQEEKSLGSIFWQVNTSVLLQDISGPTSQARQWEKQNKQAVFPLIFSKEQSESSLKEH